MLGTVEDLSKKAFEDVIKRLQKEGDAFIKHPCGFLDFKAGGEVNIGDAEVAEEILALGIFKEFKRLNIPANILHCLVFSPRHYALVVMSDEDSNRYILLRDSTTERQWWVEGDMKQKMYRFVDYEQIPEFVRKAIECELAKRAWSQLITHMQMSDAEEI